MLAGGGSLCRWLWVWSFFPPFLSTPSIFGVYKTHERFFMRVYPLSFFQRFLFFFLFLAFPSREGRLGVTGLYVSVYKYRGFGASWQTPLYIFMFMFMFMMCVCLCVCIFWCLVFGANSLVFVLVLVLSLGWRFRWMDVFFPLFLPLFSSSSLSCSLPPSLLQIHLRKTSNHAALTPIKQDQRLEQM